MSRVFVENLLKVQLYKSTGICCPIGAALHGYFFVLPSRDSD